MDLREIQNLHAQYASQPVVIDIGGQLGAAQAIPALPSPNRDDGHSTGAGGFSSAARRYAKPLALAVALVIIAGGAGIGGARLWARLQPGPQSVAAAPATPAASAHTAAATVQPLTSADFGASGASDGLATVNARELLQRMPPAAAPAVQAFRSAPNAEATGDAARALAAPIHAPHAPGAAPAVGSPAAAPASGTTTEHEPKRAAAAPHQGTAGGEPATEPRHLRHVPVHHTRPTTESTVSQVSSPNDRVTPPAAAPTKASDVQLF